MTASSKPVPKERDIVPQTKPTSTDCCCCCFCCCRSVVFRGGLLYMQGTHKSSEKPECVPDLKAIFPPRRTRPKVSSKWAVAENKQPQKVAWSVSIVFLSVVPNCDYRGGPIRNTMERRPKARSLHSRFFVLRHRFQNVVRCRPWPRNAGQTGLVLPRIVGFVGISLWYMMPLWSQVLPLWFLTGWDDTLDNDGSLV